jgi:hypothetical protein
MGASGNPLYAGNDLMTSKRFSQKYQEWQQKETQIVDELAKSASAPIGTTGSTIMTKMLDLQRHRQNTPTTSQMAADHKSMENFWGIMSSTSKDDKDSKVNKTLAQKLLKQREDYLNGVDNGYELGVTANTIPGMVYREKDEKEKLKNIYTEINKPIEDEVVDSSGRVITTKTTKKVLDSKLASQAILDRVWADSGQRSYLSDVYGVDLWDVTPDNEASVKEVLRDRIQKTIEYDDKLYNGAQGITTNVSTQFAPADQNYKKVDINYNVSGGRTDKKETTVSGLSQPRTPGQASQPRQRLTADQIAQSTTEESLRATIPGYKNWGDIKKNQAKKMAEAQLAATGTINGEEISRIAVETDNDKIYGVTNDFVAKQNTIKEVSDYGVVANDGGTFDITQNPALMDAKDVFEQSTNPKFKVTGANKPTDHTKVTGVYMTKFLEFLKSKANENTTYAQFFEIGSKMKQTKPGENASRAPKAQQKKAEPAKGSGVKVGNTVLKKKAQ